MRLVLIKHVLKSALFKSLSTKFLLIVSLGVVGVVAYMHYEEPDVVSIMVQPLEQELGSSTSLHVPMNQDSFVSSSTVRMDGLTMMQTPYLWIDHSSSYYVSTYSGLPVGDYNIIVNLKYNLNPIKSVEQKFTLATLQVKNKDGKEYSGFNIYEKYAKSKGTVVHTGGLNVDAAATKGVCPINPHPRFKLSH